MPCNHDHVPQQQERHQDGFSLLELVVAVTIVLILGVVGMVSYQQYASNARDAVRMRHVHEITLALTLYAEEHGHLMGQNSGCGRLDEYEGSGWFNRGGPHDPGSETTIYDKSIMDCLVEANVLTPGIIDPLKNSSFGITTKDDPRSHAYMKYSCDLNGTTSERPQTAYVFAKLENVSEEDRKSPDGICPGYPHVTQAERAYIAYGMNHWERVDVF